MPLKRLNSLMDSDEEDMSLGSPHTPIRRSGDRLSLARTRRGAKRQAIARTVSMTSSGRNDIAKTKVKTEDQVETTTKVHTQATSRDSSVGEHTASPSPSLSCSPRSFHTTMSTSGSRVTSRSLTPSEHASPPTMRQSPQCEDRGDGHDSDSSSGNSGGSSSSSTDDKDEPSTTLTALARRGGRSGLAKLRRALIQKDDELRSHKTAAQRLKAERDYISRAIDALEEIEQTAGRLLQAMSAISGLEE